MEQPPINASSSNENEKKPKNSVHFTRHSRASYATYASIAKSENPTGPVDKEKQVLGDLTEGGIELARQEAEKFFAKLHSEEDELFFVSSNEVRALETANIYKQIAKEKSFNVLKPENVRGGLAEQISGGDVRVVDALSLNIKNNLLGMVFSSDSQIGTINLDALDPETRAKWAEARKIINAGDKGSWGNNFAAHSPEIKKIFPEIKDVRDVYESQFKNLVRLAKFGIEKARKSGTAKNIKILAFGHENYMSHALDTYFANHEIKNCETVVIDVNDAGEHTIERRGEKKIVTE